MADPIGTALGALGVVGLVSVCLDCFNFISDGLSVGKDFVLLEAQFSALKIRLLAWTIACGFFKPEGYDKRFDEPLWKQHVQKQLNSISLLFLDAAKLIKRYDLLDRRIQHTRVITLGESTLLIEEGLNDFLKRIKKTKRQAGLRGLFTWALKDKKQFSELNERLGICIDALEQVSANLDLFTAAKHSIQAQVNTISDIESLEGMAGALSDSSGSSIVSDAASQRLVILGHGSIIEISTLKSDRTEVETFLTAKSRFSEDLRRASGSSGVPLNSNDCTEPSDLNSFSNVIDDTEMTNPITTPRVRKRRKPRTTATAANAQNARLMTAVLASYRETNTPVFKSLNIQESRWGENIRQMKLENKGSLISLPDIFLADVYRLNTKARRLRVIKEVQEENSMILVANSPNLSNVIIAFEGGQSTPYQGGIFYVQILLPLEYPWVPPKAQLLTKVYHPNIDPNGQICVDYLGNGWGPISQGFVHVIMVILALLDQPSVEDPLVPEIALTYLEDREQYIQNARTITEKYAHCEQEIVSRLGLR